MAAFSEAEGVFVANDRNLVVIEAESAVIQAESTSSSGGWLFQNDLEGYTGTGYYRWDSKREIERTPGAGTLRYTVKLLEDGPYRLSMHTLRNGRAEGRDVKGDQENDFWVRVNDGSWEKINFHGPYGEWTWANSLSINHQSFPAQYELSAGIHTIEISGRSRNAMFDRIHLAKDKVNVDITKPPSERIDAVPLPPVISQAIDNVQVLEKGVTTLINLFPVFGDIDTEDEDLQYSIQSNSNQALVTTSIDPVTGVLTLSYPTGQDGVAELVVKATDEDGLSASTAFSVTIDVPEEDNSNNGQDPDGNPGPSNPGPTNPGPTNPGPSNPGPTNPGPSNPGNQGNGNPPIGSVSGTIEGSARGDRLVGTKNNDTINALGGKDNVKGKAGDDLLNGGGGNDKMNGGAGNDILVGGAGNDKLVGGKGNDEMDGGKGRDIYKGGPGDDIFVIEAGRKFDIVNDFKDGDLIRLGSGLRFNQIDATQRGRHTVLSVEDDVLAILKRFDADDFTKAVIA
ncbi:MAG: hypothetical protein VKL39_14500 [Leptolyngbyaceae bacterium]|nr:hypothetical protein [Leptolyngbyaceae bacterium]